MMVHIHNPSTRQAKAYKSKPILQWKEKKMKGKKEEEVKLS